MIRILQETYNQYKIQGNYDKNWHARISKAVQVLQNLRTQVVPINTSKRETRRRQRQALLGEIFDYASLNTAFQQLMEDPNIDFLDHFLFKQNNGIGSTGNRLLSVSEKKKIKNDIEKKPEIIFDIITATSLKLTYDKIHDLFEANEWIIIHRFARVLFPEHLTALDSPGLFKDLLGTLRIRFGLGITADSMLEQSQEILDLADDDDFVLKQLFFWDLLQGYGVQEDEKRKKESFKSEGIRELIKVNVTERKNFWWLNTDGVFSSPIEHFQPHNDLYVDHYESGQNWKSDIKPGDLVISGYSDENIITGIIEFYDETPDRESRRYTKLYIFKNKTIYTELKSLPLFGKKMNEVIKGGLYSIDRAEFQEVINTTELRLQENEDVHTELITSAYNDSVKHSEDLLGVSREVEVFARLLAQKDLTPPLAIALFGNWGSGKSFFMHNLEMNIKQLSDSNTLKPDGTPFYCKEIVHISFNAWSYLDANLWVGFMASIFEKLDEYVRGITKGEKEKLQLEEKIFHELEFVQNQKTKALIKKRNLEKEKQQLEDKLQEQKGVLDKRIANVKKKKWSEITETAWEQIAEDDGIKTKLAELDITPDILEKSPSLYVKNRVSSFNNYLRQFIKFNFPQVAGFFLILGTLVLLPFFADQILKTLSSILITTGTFISGVVIKIGAAWKVFKPLVTKALNIQTQYVQKIKEVEKEHIEDLSLLHLEKVSKSNEIQDLTNEIEDLEEEITDVEYSLSHSLTKMALNNFISERSTSADYQEQLGIVSIIRRDLETLSALFISQEIDERLPEKEKELLKKKNEKLEKIREGFGDKSLERIILYIDDLDRCADNKVLEVLQAVHLLMAFPLFIVVVGVDKRCVTNALYKREVSKYFQLTENNEYKEDEEEGLHIFHPDEYLEKIFQIPFQLKKPSPDNINNMIHELLEKDILDEDLAKPISEESKRSDSNEPKESLDQNDEVSDEKGNEGKKGSEPTISSEPLTEPVVPPEGLRITQPEREFIKEISSLIGSTPRAIKRFINVYRLVRAHQNLQSINDEKEYQIVIFILMMHLGKNKEKADDLFLTMRENQNSTLNEILSMMDDRKFKELRLELNFAIPLDLANVKAGDFVDYLSFIRRFSFNAIEEPIPFIQKRNKQTQTA